MGCSSYGWKWVWTWPLKQAESKMSLDLSPLALDMWFINVQSLKHGMEMFSQCLNLYISKPWKISPLDRPFSGIKHSSRFQHCHRCISMAVKTCRDTVQNSCACSPFLHNVLAPHQGMCECHHHVVYHPETPGKWALVPYWALVSCRHAVSRASSTST